MGKQRSSGTASDSKPAADADVFRAAVRDVKPLGQTPVPVGLHKPKPRVTLRKHKGTPREDLDQFMPLIATRSHDEPASLEAETAGNAALSFQRSGVRVQVMRRLRRGLCPIDSELDLHGLSQSMARDRLADFIVRARESGCRCVRIIHGKGYRSGGRGPVLKTAVNLWLRRHLDVIAFTSARAIDGGTGALYVLLRT